MTLWAVGASRGGRWCERGGHVGESAEFRGGRGHGPPAGHPMLVTALIAQPSVEVNAALVEDHVEALVAVIDEGVTNVRLPSSQIKAKPCHFILLVWQIVKYMYI